MKFDVWKDIMSHRSNSKFRPDPVKGKSGGNLNSWKTLRLEGSGRNLEGKISLSPGLRYGSGITGTVLLSLGDLGGTLILKNRKMKYF